MNYKLQTKVMKVMADGGDDGQRLTSTPASIPFENGNHLATKMIPVVAMAMPHR